METLISFEASSQLADAGISLNFTGLLFVLMYWGKEPVRREVGAVRTKELCNIFL